MLPSSKSVRKIISSDRHVASKALIQITPGIMIFKNSDFDPNDKGNNKIIIIKKTNELKKSNWPKKVPVKCNLSSYEI